jgi:phospholipid/cholesterol/gamma-HCH transport system substrate-binding protein
MNPPDPSSDAPEAVSPGVQRRALGMLVLLVALVVGSAAYLMYARGVFEASHRLVLLADDAEGVTVGMDMSFAGFPIGRVQRIELGADGLARIVVNVPRKDANWLRTSSVFTLERSLVGSTKLRAYSGILSDPPLPDGAERSLLKGDALAELPQLMDAVRTLLGNLNQLSAPDAALAQTLGNVAATTAKLQGPRGALSVLMGNEAEATRLLTQVQTILASTQALLTRLDGVAQRTDGLLANANTQVFGPQGLATDAQRLTRQLAGAAAEARQSLKKVDALLVDAQAVTGNAREASTDLNLLRADVEASLRKLDGMVNDIQRKWPFAQDPEVKLP